MRESRMGGKFMYKKKCQIVLVFFVFLAIIPNSCAQKGTQKESTAILVSGNYVDFTYAAENTINAVVHISAEMEQKHGTWDLFFSDPLFGLFNQGQSRVYQAYGSGVILYQDGYIVTNNHVVEGAIRVSVTLNDKRSFEAEVVGTDPQNDLALLKIAASGLQTVSFGNSDSIRIGEWVLAVGNPFNLTSTVTAGIVSAKARNLNKLNENNQVSTYIQTDAAVNSGNSGGALVNAKGELMGINAAIASNTGSFTGYSFAIPSNIVKKVVEDLRRYGRVQRVSFGADFAEIDAKKVEDLHLANAKGLQILGVEKGKAADDGGLVDGDILLKIGQKEVNSYSELKEILEQHIPGDAIECTISRDNKLLTKKITLKNKKGTTEIIRKGDILALSALGAKVEPIDDQIKARYRINNGLKITILNNGALKTAGVQEGFVITAIDKKPVSSEKDIETILADKEGNVLVQGFYPSGGYMYYYNVVI